MDGNEVSLWRRWLGLETRAGTVEPPAGETSPLVGVIPPARPLHSEITPEKAYTLGTVYRSVDLISTMVSQMDIGVYRGTSEITAPPLVRNPDLDTTITAFVEETVHSLALHGNAFWRKFGDPVASVVVLDPNTVRVSRDEKTGRKVFYIGNDRLDSSKVVHLRLGKPAGQLYGVGPVQQARRELQAAFALSEFQASWFDNNSIPTGVLKTNTPLNAVQSEAIAKAWNEFLANMSKTAILPNGISYEAIRAKPADAQMLEVTTANNLNIARAFGIPSMHLSVEMNGTSMTYMNLEQSNLLFLQGTLIKYTKEIEEALSALLPRGQVVKFKEEALLRMDTVTKWNVRKVQKDMGYKTVNEFREEDGLEPIEIEEESQPTTDGTA